MMTPKLRFLLSLLFLVAFAQGAFAQKPDLKTVICHKWKVIWFADDGVKQNMEARKQQMVLRSDGTGETFMLGQKVSDVAWSLVSKKEINFQDDPQSPPYLVKVSKYKKGSNMLFTGKMPNGVVREVYFEVLSGK